LGEEKTVCHPEHSAYQAATKDLITIEQFAQSKSSKRDKVLRAAQDDKMIQRHQDVPSNQITGQNYGFAHSSPGGFGRTFVKESESAITPA
jgi:hypothetical protein